jgi:heme A synthase
MQSFFFQMHSGWRYVILLAGALVIAYGLFGAVTNRPFDKRMRILGSSLAGVLHLQVLIGIALIFSGRFNPGSGLHVIAMIFAAVCAQIPVSVMRRRPEEERTYGPYAVWASVAMALIFVGITSMGRPLVG